MDADYLIERRVLRKRITFWRVVAFLVAIGGLAVLGEDFGNRAAGCFFDGRVGVRKGQPQALGQALADDLGCPFIEMSRDIERLAGCSTSEIQALYGQNAYRRYERRALEEAIRDHEEAVIATPGGLISDGGSFNLLLSSCTTVWLQATPEDHMKRVIEQGDMRPMAASREAMADLKSILDGRAAFYSKADLHFNTSGRDAAQAREQLLAMVRNWLSDQGFPDPENKQHTA